MKFSVLCCAVVGLAVPVFGEAESKCFKNGGLKDNEIVTFKIEGEKITGTYTIERDYSPDARETFEFSGKRTGQTLKVKFEGNRLPSPAMKSLDWTLVAIDGSEILRIKFHGKNYETNKNTDYVAEFQSCEPSYAKLAKTAERIFVGKTGGTVEKTMKFEGKDERKAFKLTLVKGQNFAVLAPGVRISCYGPDKKGYGEGGIDTFSMEKLPQGGDYLVVLMPAPEPGERSVKFTVTD